MGKDSKLKIHGYWIVLAFLFLLAFFFSQESESAELEIGPTNLSGEWSGGGMILLTEREGKWAFGGGYVSEQYCKCTWPADIKPNIFFQVHRVIDYKNWEIGIGPTYFQNTNRALGTNLNWGLSVGYKYKKWSIRLRHYSSAGSGTPNLGQDILTVGYRF